MIITKFSLPVLLISMLTLVACGNDEAAMPKKKAEHIIEVGVAEIQPVRSEIEVAGTLEAANTVNMFNEISGVITQLPLHEGDHAKKGQLLVAIDDQLIQAELAKASAQKAQAKLDYERLIKLKPRQLASDEEIARAATALDIATAEQDLQGARLSLTRLLAPFDGVVSGRFFEPGDVVAVHSHILTLIDPKSIYLKVQVAEAWIPRLHEGDSVQVRIDSLANIQGKASHPGRINRIYPAIDPNTRKGGVEIQLQPVPAGARVGQLARVLLQTRASDQLVIPTRAIHHDTQGAYVYLVDVQSKAQKVSVKKGVQHGELLEIREGLNAGDRVVTRGFIGLRDDKPVQIYRPDSSPENTPRAP
jgi:membrane fusion protein (multidrug efflux system)